MLSRSIFLGFALVVATVGAAQAQVSLGDMNCDGRVDGLDVQPFVDCLLDGNCPPPCSRMEIETVPVENAGNDGDTRYPSGGVSSFGGVDYTYDIGRYEVTAGQYTKFLNAVAATDTYGLYDDDMGNFDYHGCGIAQTGESGSYHYHCLSEAVANRPVNYVGWEDAARFCNWLHNGQPTGPQGLATTEDGAYFLNGATSSEALIAVTRKLGARWAIPTEDEWYKAAYHKNDGVTGNYWYWPTRTENYPNNGNPEGDTGNSANFWDGADVTVGKPYYRTDGGYFSLSYGPYGTFDQGGNVFEWNEGVSGSYRGWRGGGCFSWIDYLAAWNRSQGVPVPMFGMNDLGFRVVELHGACCEPNGACVATKQEYCEGTWQGVGTDCSSVVCPQPTGSCCQADGSCTVTLEVDCTGTWTMFGVCDPNPCPPPTGSCCQADGSCTVTLQANCTGTWTMFGVCSPNPCPQPTGSCCQANGSCTVTLQANCTGTWTMFGVCNPNPCPQPGACCYTDGSCSVTLEANCTGTWNGPGTSCTPNPCTPAGMVLIPVGEFQMGNSFTGEGNSDELPRHAVHVDAFFMDTYEVTNQQYCDALNWAKSQGNLISVISGVVYKYNSGTSYPYCDTTTSSSYSRIINGTTFGVTAGKANHPMVQVSWYGSVAYANWRSGMQGKPLCYDLSTWTCNFGSGYRLPTEAEWEKAGRGGTPGHRFPWSDQDTIQHARCNYYSSSSYSYDTSPTRDYHPCWGVSPYPYTSPMGFFDGSLRYKVDFNWPGSPTSYQTANGANSYGLHDMAGNVWEWCNDWYSSTYYDSSPYNNPHGPTSGTGRVVRGGSWAHSADFCRVAYRYNFSPGIRYHYVGLRLALDSP
jgi:formylglycine-generating enzyme required for sulfatase activity